VDLARWPDRLIDISAESRLEHQHHFPFFELLANIRRNGRNVPLTHLQFLGQLVLHMLPTSAH